MPRRLWPNDLPSLCPVRSPEHVACQLGNIQNGHRLGVDATDVAHLRDAAWIALMRGKRLEPVVHP
jgi:hypothetical protein